MIEWRRLKSPRRPLTSRQPRDPRPHPPAARVLRAVGALPWDTAAMSKRHVFSQDSPWTERKIAHLRALWEQGVPAIAIAQQLGRGVTKNAVVAMARRIGCTPRANPAPRKPKSEAKPKPAPKLATKPVFAAPARTSVNQPFAVRRMVENPGRATSCQWPIGEPGTRSFKFCEGAIEGRLPYCAVHHARATMRPARAEAA